MFQLLKYRFIKPNYFQPIHAKSGHPILMIMWILLTALMLFFISKLHRIHFLYIIFNIIIFSVLNVLKDR